ncbi:MAG: trypsin-like peptidase domain-containing protein [Nitrososphaerota archaeon]|jgi:S1-C subfamily serine protease|nr:trypsin-like peptidase domain-containing protein [Nitrososphaerota archaeon]
MTETPENQNETTATPTPQTEENNTPQELTTADQQENLPETQMSQDEPEQVTIDTSTSAATENIYCTQCGETIENNYCKQCGTVNESEAAFEPIEDNNTSPPPVPPTQSKPRSQRQKSRNTKTVILALLAVCMLTISLIGYVGTYYMFNDKVNDLQNQLSSTQESFRSINDRLNTLQSQLLTSQSNEQNNNSYDVYISSNSTEWDLTELYQNVRQSVVVVQCLVPQYNWFGYQVGYSTQQGSGFVTTASGQQVIATNYHVINSGSNVTVTFADGSSYTAVVLGSDAYVDLAILKVNNMPSGVSSLALVSSSTLNVGDAVVAVGSPYGLTGTITTGIISALGRTITETVNGRSITIADIIQTTTEINPGNSGGPLINYRGEVVGITTATVSNSQGLGFAISSDTIRREIDALINTGKYTQHSALGVSGRDMTLQLAQSMNVDITYGWLIETATESSGLKSGDIIIKAGSTTITNLDDLLTYLERNTLPGQHAEFTVIRNGQQETVTVYITSLST